MMVQKVKIELCPSEYMQIYHFFLVDTYHDVYSMIL